MFQQNGFVHVFIPRFVNYCYQYKSEETRKSSLTQRDILFNEIEIYCKYFSIN